MNPEAYESEMLARALRKTAGNVVAAGRLLGMARSTIWRRVAKYWPNPEDRPS